jgi:hypothetical protein
MQRSFPSLSLEARKGGRQRPFFSLSLGARKGGEREEGREGLSSLSSPLLSLSLSLSLSLFPLSGRPVDRSGEGGRWGGGELEVP